ncbi:MAG: polyphosphate kinase 2, partial [Zoogloea sp.]
MNENTKPTATQNPAPATKPARPARPATRRVKAGDTAPRLDAKSIENSVVEKATEAAQAAKEAALGDLLQTHTAESLALGLKALLENASPDDRAVLRRALKEPLRNPLQSKESDTQLAPDWRDGGYPYLNLMSRRNYERQKYRLQVELLKLQAWVKATGQ